MTRPLLDLSVYLVTDTAQGGRVGVPAVAAAAAVAGGVTVVQVRDKQAGDRELLVLVRAVQAALTGTGVPVIVNDWVDVAVAARADGAHIGQGDLDPAAARALLGPDRLLGVSCSRGSEIAAVAALPVGTVDYLGFGPVHPTGTKQTGPPLGVAATAALCALSPLASVAIGGLDELTAGAVIAGGVDGIAVVSAICRAADPASAARGLRAAVAAARR